MFSSYLKKKAKLLGNQTWVNDCEHWCNLSISFWGNFPFLLSIKQKGRFTEESQEIKKKAQYKHMQKKSRLVHFLIMPFLFHTFLLFFFKTVFIHVL